MLASSLYAGRTMKTFVFLAGDSKACPPGRVGSGVIFVFTQLNEKRRCPAMDPAALRSRSQLLQLSIRKIEHVIHRGKLPVGQMSVVLQLDAKAMIVPPKAGYKQRVIAGKWVVQKNNSTSMGRADRQLLKLADQA